MKRADSAHDFGRPQAQDHENPARAGVGGVCALSSATNPSSRPRRDSDGAFCFSAPVSPAQQWRHNVPSPSTNPRQSYRLRRSPPVVAIIGATGAVGRELLGVLERREFPLAELRLFASPRSAGKALPFRRNEITVAALSEDSFDGVDLALFSAGSETAREYAPAAMRNGAVVIDNSSAFRMDPKVPLIVPEINPD